MRKSIDFDSIADRISADAAALVEFKSPMSPWRPADPVRVKRTYNTADPFEAELFELLRRGGLKLLAAGLAAEQESEGDLRPQMSSDVRFWNES